MTEKKTIAFPVGPAPKPIPRACSDVFRLWAAVGLGIVLSLLFFIAQDLYQEQLRGAGLVLCLGSMLHSIAVGNMCPSWVKIICIDINPAVATKVSDRGTGQAIGVITDVGLFLDLLAHCLSPEWRKDNKTP